MKNLPKRLEIFFAETSLPKRPAPPTDTFSSKSLGHKREREFWTLTRPYSTLNMKKWV